MSASPPTGLFKPAQQGHSLAILVFIENSATMIGRWPDLRDHYLPTLLGTVRKVNPVVPIQVIFLPSCPVSASEEAFSHTSSSRLGHLPEVRFSQQPNNKITAATLSNAADILANTLVETSTTRHLFVIAASGPSESADVPSHPDADPQPTWQALGSKLTKENIHLHMILNPKIQESENFTQLFYEILAMQRFQEAATWFPTNKENYRFHLSMRSQGHQEGSSHPFPSTALHHTQGGFGGTASAPPQRIPLPRLNSFPPASANGRPTLRSTAASSTNNSPPSPATSIPPTSSDAPGLVKHLQKVHGLTKKRNYGFQSSRSSFIRDETAIPPYPPSPVHSVDPVNGRPRRNTGVHASKNKKGDDPRRPRRGSVHVGLPESARVSSPDSDSSASVGAPSPTATVAGVLAPPGGPVSVGGLQQMAMPVSSAPHNNLAEAGYATGVPPPSLWQSEALVQTQQQAAPASAGPAFTDMLPTQQMASQARALAPTQTQAQQSRTHMRAVVPPASSSYSNMPHGNPDSPVAYSTAAAASALGSSFLSQQQQQPSAMHTTPSTLAPVQAPAPTGDDGDKPFIFYPEYEDALMPQAPLFAPLSAAAQPTPMTQFWPTASAEEYAHILNPAATPGLLRGNPTPVYDISAYDAPVHPQPNLAHVGSHVQHGVVYASEQSSSLQSWAGY